MTAPPNGTYAKDIALHFVAMTNERATPHIMKRTVNQAKSLLSNGYTKEEIIEVIDYLIQKKGIRLYSLGYVNTCINKILHEINTEKEKEKLRTLPRNEVVTDDESSERNQRKRERFGVQSGFRKKHNFDMFERQ